MNRLSELDKSGRNVVELDVIQNCVEPDGDSCMSQEICERQNTQIYFALRACTYSKPDENFALRACEARKPKLISRYARGEDGGLPRGLGPANGTPLPGWGGLNPLAAGARC